MVVTESGMATLANELQYWKARSPMVVTESGMVMFVNELHPKKALCPMVVTREPKYCSGISTSPVASFRQPETLYSLMSASFVYATNVRGVVDTGVVDTHLGFVPNN